VAGDPTGAVPVQAVTISGPEDWPFAAFVHGQVDRPGGPRSPRDGHDFAALAGDDQCPVAALDAHRFGISARAALGASSRQFRARLEECPRRTSGGAEPGRAA
jgi:hypothetical protein